MFEQMLGLPVPMRAGVVCISVWNCRADVARFVALPDGAITTEYATNSDELADDATQAVSEQGGAINVSGFYHCPPEIAARAQWKATDSEGIGK